MNKKERAEVDALLDQLRLTAALRWSEPVAPDVPPFGLGVVNGYLPIAATTDAPRVSEACTSTINHGLQHGKTTTQQPRALYSTRLLALRALRYMVATECARRLAHVDRQIEELTAKVSP